MKQCILIIVFVFAPVLVRGNDTMPPRQQEFSMGLSVSSTVVFRPKGDTWLAEIYTHHLLQQTLAFPLTLKAFRSLPPNQQQIWERLSHQIYRERCKTKTNLQPAMQDHCNLLNNSETYSAWTLLFEEMFFGTNRIVPPENQVTYQAFVKSQQKAAHNHVDTNEPIEQHFKGQWRGRFVEYLANSVRIYTVNCDGLDTPSLARCSVSRTGLGLAVNGATEDCFWRELDYGWGETNYQPAKQQIKIQLQEAGYCATKISFVVRQQAMQASQTPTSKTLKRGKECKDKSESKDYKMVTPIPYYIPVHNCTRLFLQ